MRIVSLFSTAFMALLIATGFAEDNPSDAKHDETQLQTSDWGTAENSLQLRVSAPRELEQGMVLPLKLEVRQQDRRQIPDIAHLNLFLLDEYISLLLTGSQRDQTWIARPLDPTAGMPPPPDTNRSSVALTGAELEPWETRIPLVQLYDELKPGTYTAQIQFKFPQEPTHFWRGTQAEWKAAGFWHGTLVSGPFQLSLKPETPRTTTLTVPKQLRFRTEEVQLREGDKTKTAIPAVYFDKRDAESVEVPVRNGHYRGTFLYLNGEQVALSGDLLKPDSPNAIDAWYDYKGGDRKVTYTIEVFETADPPQHLWMPGPGSKSYKTMWKKTYRVSYSRKSL